MKRFLMAFLFAVLVFCVCFAASAEPKSVKLSVEKNSYFTLGDIPLQVSVTASAQVGKELHFSYMLNGEIFEAVMPAGTKKTCIPCFMPCADEKMTIEFVLLSGEGYTLGDTKSKITVIPDPVFNMGKGGLTATSAGESISISFAVADRKMLTSGLMMELRDAEGNSLGTKTFSKDSYRASFRFTVPKEWTGVNPVALWFGGRKVSDDYLVVIRKNEPVIRSIATDSRKIVITVDCGAGTDYHMRKWLDLLDEYDAKATFFMTGYFLKNNPTAAAEAIARGHDVGNHSMTHQKLSDKKFDVVSQEVEGVNRLIFEQTDGYVPRYFRAPYGSWGYSMNAMLEYLNMATIQWEISSGDSENSVTKQEIFRNATEKDLKPGAIILFHNATPGFSVMDDVFKYYKEQGYEMVSLSMLMPEEYTIDANGVVRAAE